MRNLIEERYPSHGIYGEEYGAVRVDADFVWVLDPIDGTKSFITGKPLFGTLISCLYKGTPIVGVIDQCILKERWVGSYGSPTTLNERTVHVNDNVQKLSDAVLYTTTPDMFQSEFEKAAFKRVRDKSKLVLYGCDCYAYALVASGFGADGVIEASLGLYDYCALVPVVEGAGGIMSDFKGRRLCLQNHDDSEGQVIASSNPGLHEDMLRTIRECGH